MHHCRLSRGAAPVLPALAAALMIALPFVACGDSARDPTAPPEPEPPAAPPPEPTRPPSLALAVVSGDNQPGMAGRMLPTPFVVRVTNDRGEAEADRTVTWTVATGQGAFTDDRISDRCWQPLSTTSVQTDASGLAQVPFIPAWLGPVTVTARAAGAPNAVTFATDASDAGAVVRVIEGHHWVGKAGEWIDGVQYAEQLKVLVTDGLGNPVPHVPVTWAILSGDAWLDGCEHPDAYPAIRTTRTRSDGTAYVYMLPTTPGTTTLAAAVPLVLFSPVMFTVEVTAAVINLGPSWGGGRAFFGPGASPSSDVTVPVGATVEWVNHFAAARVVSVSAPPGGAAVDSGVLGQGERFAFVPIVPGTWEFVDEVSGAAGRLTAR
jgi:hypothetical protein